MEKAKREAEEQSRPSSQHNRFEVPHMLLDDVRVGDVVELNTPTAGQTFHVFVYEIAEDEVRYRYGLMGPRWDSVSCRTSFASSDLTRRASPSRLIRFAGIMPHTGPFFCVPGGM